MRIVSLLPSITEIVCALGLGDHLVGITHECDYPALVAGLPVVTRSLLDHSMATSAEIDAAVRTQLHNDLSLYDLNMAALESVGADVILTQALCEVCAVSYTHVCQAVCELDKTATGIQGSPQVVSLEPTTLEEILGTMSAVGEITGYEQNAAELIAGLNTRIDRVRNELINVPRQRIALLEWFDPPYSPGHWMPELVDIVRGEPGFGEPGQPSRRISWSDVIAFAPEVIILTPCGFSLDRAAREAETILPSYTGWHALPAVRAGRVYAVDGNSYFSRPGPRIVDSLELLAELVHPERCAGWGPKMAARRVCVSEMGEG